MSEFRFGCPHCGQRITGDAGYQGSEIVCPSCQQTLTVPNPAARTTLPHPRPIAAGTADQPISTPALLSFVCLLGLGLGSLPAIVFGHLARVQLRRRPELRGRRLAGAGLALGYVLLLCSLAFLAVGIGLRPKLGRPLTVQQEAANPAGPNLVDEVRIGETASEAEHELQSRFSGSGMYLDRHVRDAWNGGFFSYVLKANPVQPMKLRCTYWGNDNDRRRFDVLVNDRVIATQQLEFNAPGRFFSVDYDLPPDLTLGKARVTVVFQAYPRSSAGGLYGCQMLKRTKTTTQ